MTTTDVNNVSAWLTTNKGAEYTLTVPFDNPHFPQGMITVLMLCEGAPFSQEDREHARQRLDECPKRLSTIFSQLTELLGVAKAQEFESALKKPTLMLVAGDLRHWTFAIDTEPKGTSLFVEWENNQITGIWCEV